MSSKKQAPEVIVDEVEKQEQPKGHLDINVLGMKLQSFEKSRASKVHSINHRVPE